MSSLLHILKTNRILVSCQPGQRCEIDPHNYELDSARLVSLFMAKFCEFCFEEMWAWNNKVNLSQEADSSLNMSYNCSDTKLAFAVKYGDFLSWAKIWYYKARLCIHREVLVNCFKGLSDIWEPIDRKTFSN